MQYLRTLPYLGVVAVLITGRILDIRFRFSAEAVIARFLREWKRHLLQLHFAAYYLGNSQLLVLLAGAFLAGQLHLFWMVALMNV